MAWEKVAVGAAVLGALALLAMLLWPVARHRFIYPGGSLAPSMAEPSLHGLVRSEQVWLETSDGVRIHAWWTPAEGEARGAVLYCHGNAESMATRAWIADRLARLGLHVLLFDYRGYGLSRGRASGEGLARDARAAWRHVTAGRGVEPGRVLLMGHSLGSAVATRLALELAGDAGYARHAGGAWPPTDGRPAGLVVGSPFPDMPALFAHHAPWLPGWALRWRRDRLDAGSRLGQVGVPVLAITGTGDAVIPPAMSRAVYEAAAEPKRLVTVPADHATVMGHPAVWDAIRRFAQESLDD